MSYFFFTVNFIRRKWIKSVNASCCQKMRQPARTGSQSWPLVFINYYYFYWSLSQELVTKTTSSEDLSILQELHAAASGLFTLLITGISHTFWCSVPLGDGTEFSFCKGWNGVVPQFKPQLNDALGVEPQRRPGSRVHSGSGSGSRSS